MSMLLAALALSAAPTLSEPAARPLRIADTSTSCQHNGNGGSGGTDCGIVPDRRSRDDHAPLVEERTKPELT
jgi:hypothetical protein